MAKPNQYEPSKAANRYEALPPAVGRDDIHRADAEHLYAARRHGRREVTLEEACRLLKEQLRNDLRAMEG